MDFKDFNAPIRYGASLGEDLTNTNGDITITGGRPFYAVKSFGTADIQDATGSSLTILADGSVWTGGSIIRKVYLTDYKFILNETAWAGTNGSIVIADAAGTVFLYLDGTALRNTGTSFPQVLASVGTTTGTLNVIDGTGSVTYKSPFYRMTGGTLGRGLVVKLGGATSDWATGGTVNLIVTGFIK